MKKMVLVLCLAALAAGVGAQCQQANDADATVSAKHESPKAGAEILSDTMGVDFGPYIRVIHADIQRNWNALVPEEAKSPERRKGVVGIRVTILPNGNIGDMKLETKTGDLNLDKAAWYSITAEGHFPPLPQQFHGPNLCVRIGFFYNTSVSPAN